MRHAKSDWTDPFQDDHDRVLNDRGRKSATALGKWLRSSNRGPDQVLCSSSARTKETWHLVEREMESDAAVIFMRALYLATAQDMLATLQATAVGRRLLVIGHNPGTGQLAEMLLEASVGDPTFRRYPTGYTTVISFDIGSWKEIDWGKGALMDHIGPRSLLGSG